MISTLAVLLWVVAIVVLFRRLPLATAFSLSIIGAYLLLPGNFRVDLPLVPELNKTTVPILTAFAMVLFGLHQSSPVQGSHQSSSQVLPGWIPRDPLIVFLMAILILGELGTVLTNGDNLAYGPRRLPSLSLYDAFARMLNTVVQFLPVLLARKLLSTDEAQRQFLVVFAACAVAYAFLALYEVRFSPQLNKNVYGYFPHTWRQHVRDGGFRPVVFLNHGLSLGIFLAGGAIVAFVLSRLREPKPQRPPAMFWFGAGILLAGTLLVSRNLGAVMLLCLLLPVALFLGARIHLLVAATLACMLLTYPLLRSADLAPTERVARVAERIDEARASSFRFRVRNEDLLLDKALERPFFGWGGWGRSRVFDSSGRDIAITDGHWVITLGLGGWIKYLGLYGLLVIPLVRCALNSRALNLGLIQGAMGLVLAANLLYLIPNAFVSPMVYMMVGAFIARLEMLRRGAGETSQPESTVSGSNAAPKRKPPPASRRPPTDGATVSNRQDTVRDSTIKYSRPRADDKYRRRNR